MTKKEKHQLINRDFLTFVEEEMNDRYDIEDNGEGGRVHLMPDGGESMDSIDYHLSRHTVDVFNNCSTQTSTDVETMEQKLDELVKQYEL